MVKKKNLGVCILLSIITMGIYSIIWFISVTNDLNKLSDDPKPSGGVAFLLTVITCNLYGWFWAYKMGKKLDKAKQAKGQAPDDKSTLFLILQIFGFSLINMILIQLDVNNMADA